MSIEGLLPIAIVDRLTIEDLRGMEIPEPNLLSIHIILPKTTERYIASHNAIYPNKPHTAPSSYVILSYHGKEQKNFKDDAMTIASSVSRTTPEMVMIPGYFSFKLERTATPQYVANLHETYRQLFPDAQLSMAYFRNVQPNQVSRFNLPAEKTKVMTLDDYKSMEKDPCWFITRAFNTYVPL